MEPNNNNSNDCNQNPRGFGPNPNIQPPGGRPNGFSVAAMIMGIASVVLLCCGGSGIPVGILGLIFALLSRETRRMNTQAKIGFGLSLGGIGLAVVFLILNILLIFSSGILPDMFDMMKDYNLNTQEGVDDFLDDWQDRVYEGQAPEYETPKSNTPQQNSPDYSGPGYENPDYSRPRYDYKSPEDKYI